VPIVRSDAATTRVFVLGSLVLAWYVAAHAAPPASPPVAGHERALSGMWAAEPPAIDGVPDEWVWQSGAVAEGFWVSEAQHPPADETRVVVLYDDQALYFAFICFDRRPELIRASQITRDAAPGLDDRVTVELDPYHNHRLLSRFTVTARGTQSDALAGGRAQNLEWKGKWRAAARRTSDGWTAELAIPLDMLEFEPGTATFGINFSRFQNRTTQWSEWANLTPQRLPEEAGHLVDLYLPRSAAPARLSVMQYVAGGMSDAPGHGRDPGDLNAGMNVRYQWRGTMTTLVSARPDFSAVEKDVAGIGFSYTEKFSGDRRPFFQEGEAFFGDREVFHSGRIEDFDVGAKTFGRVDAYQIGLLATTDASDGRADYVGRIVREVGPAFNMSATLAGTARETFDNNTLQLEAGGRVGRHLRVESTLARSSSTGAADDTTRSRGELVYQTSHWYSGGWADYTGLGYLPANGFLAADLIGTSGRGAYGGYNRAFGDRWMRRLNASAAYDVRETASGLRQREVASVYAGAETLANVQVSGGMTVGAYRPTADEPGTWADVVNDDRVFLASAYYQHPTGQFGYGAHYSWGLVGRQEYATVAPSVWLAPSSHVSLAYSFERAAYDAVQHQHVLSGTWEIDGAQALAARWVDYDGGYYHVSYRRMLATGVDAFGVYSSDPYNPGRLNVKLVWTFSPFQRR
jgi:hypothetical protein